MLLSLIITDSESKKLKSVDVTSTLSQNVLNFFIMPTFVIGIRVLQLRKIEKDKITTTLFLSHQSTKRFVSVVVLVVIRASKSSCRYMQGIKVNLGIYLHVTLFVKLPNGSNILLRSTDTIGHTKDLNY